jgi:hypothetical protein
MATRTDRFMSAARRAARQAKRWATVAARGADRLLQAVRDRAQTEVRRRRFKRTLVKTGRVLQAAGRAALVAGVAAGVTAASGEGNGRKRPKSRRGALAPESESTDR